MNELNQNKGVITIHHLMEPKRVFRGSVRMSNKNELFRLSIITGQDVETQTFSLNRSDY